MKFILAFAALAILTVHGASYGQRADAVEARRISSPKIIVPDEAKVSSLGGPVKVLVSLDEAGNVVEIQKVTGPGAVCDPVDRPDVAAIRQTARSLALQSKFSPETRDGQAIPSTIWVTFDFPGKKGANDFAFEADAKNYSASDAPPPDSKVPVSKGGPPKTISGGVLDGKASELARPAYPPAARAVRATGTVKVQVLIDEQGVVFLAQAVEGHRLLRASSVAAACGSKFMPTLLSGNPVKVSGILQYNFIP